MYANLHSTLTENSWKSIQTIKQDFNKRPDLK